jgi:hypothetical protein
MRAKRPLHGRWDFYLRRFLHPERTTVAITVRESGRRVHHGAGLRRESGGVRGRSKGYRRRDHLSVPQKRALKEARFRLLAEHDRYHRRPQVGRTSILRRMVGGRSGAWRGRCYGLPCARFCVRFALLGPYIGASRVYGDRRESRTGSTQEATPARGTSYPVPGSKPL